MAFILKKEKNNNIKIPYSTNPNADIKQINSEIKNKTSKKAKKEKCDPLIQPDDPTKVCTIDADGNFVVLNKMNPFIEAWVDFDEDLKNQLYNQTGWWTPITWGDGITIVHSENAEGIDDLFLTSPTTDLIVPEDFYDRLEFEIPNNNNYLSTANNGIKSWSEKIKDEPSFFFLVELNSNYDALLYNNFLRACMILSEKTLNYTEKVYIKLTLTNVNKDKYGENWFKIKIIEKVFDEEWWKDVLFNTVYTYEAIDKDWEMMYYYPDELAKFLYSLLLESSKDSTIEY